MLRTLAVNLLISGSLLFAVEPKQAGLAAPDDWTGETIACRQGLLPI